MDRTILHKRRVGEGAAIIDTTLSGDSVVIALTHHGQHTEAVETFAPNAYPNSSSICMQQRGMTFDKYYIMKIVDEGDKEDSDRALLLVSRNIWLWKMPKKPVLVNTTAAGLMLMESRNNIK